MNDSLITFFDAKESFLSGAHKIVRGGIRMNVTHTHPEYEDSKQREEALKDIKRACLNAISALKGDVHKYIA